MNKLDHVVTNNLKTNKDQLNEAINNEPAFDTNNFFFFCSTSEPLPVVTVYFQGGKKHRSTNVSGITFLCDSGATDIMIKRKHTKHCERNIRSNTVEYSTAAGMYCTMHDARVPFCMPGFSSRNIVNHRFRVNHKK